jgi:glucose 1-dehydrogenase
MKKTVLITGAQGGIGSACVSLFNEKGWSVIAVDKNAHSKDVLSCDVSNSKDIEALIKKIENEFGQLDALVNNAATQICKSIEHTSLEEWDQVFNTNLKSCFWLMKLTLPLLKKSKTASVINVSSVHALQTSKNIAAYAVSKGALSALTRNAAIEFAEFGIRVNSVLPGAVDTKMLRDGLQRDHVKGLTLDEKLKDLGRKHLLGRVGESKEIAQAIYFFADDQMSSFITGQSLVVDGGATIRLSTE